jgi:hypothetical protein
MLISSSADGLVAFIKLSDTGDILFDTLEYF